MSAERVQAPPELAVRLVGGLIGDHALRDALLGDLAEDFARISEERSPSAARAWYWSQVLRSALPLSRLSVSAGLSPWTRLGMSAIVAYGLLSALVTLTDRWFLRTYGDLDFGSDYSFTSGILSGGVVPISAGVLCAMAAGFLVALIGGRAPFLSAFALGLACIGVGVDLVDRSIETGSVEYQIALIVVATPSALAGALLFVRVRDAFRKWKNTALDEHGAMKS